MVFMVMCARVAFLFLMLSYQKPFIRIPNLPSLTHLFGIDFLPALTEVIITSRQAVKSTIHLHSEERVYFYCILPSGMVGAHAMAFTYTLDAES